MQLPMEEDEDDKPGHLLLVSKIEKSDKVMMWNI